MVIAHYNAFICNSITRNDEYELSGELLIFEEHFSVRQLNIPVSRSFPDQKARALVSQSIMSSRSSGGPSLPRPVTPPGVAPIENHLPKSKISFGVVCSSNINRSMEAHLVLGNAGLRVESYGSGTQVRLPGKTAMEPKIFKFGTAYEHMFHNLALDDAEYFTRNGVLQLCRRGAAVKKAPNRWQDTPTDVVQSHAVVIAFEERIYDAVIEDLQIREPTEDFKPIHVICLDTKDNPQEAALQGQVALDLCWRLEHAADEIDERAAEIIDEFQQERLHVTPIRILYQVCYL